MSRAIKKSKTDTGTGSTATAVAGGPRARPAPALNKDLLALVFVQLDGSLSETDSSAPRLDALLAVGRVCHAWRDALQATLFRDIELSRVAKITLLARSFKQNASLGDHVRRLSLRVSDVWADLGSKSSTSWKGHAAHTVLFSCRRLTQLELHLGPTRTTGHLPYLVKSISETFSLFEQLQLLHLNTSIWVADLALIMSCCPTLTALELADVRGNAARALEPFQSKSLKSISIHENTLTSGHICWLLKGQTALSTLRLGVPGDERSVFAAIESIASSLIVLRVHDRFTASKRSTAEPLPPKSCPLHAVLAACWSLEEFELSYDFAGPSEELDSLITHISTSSGLLRKLYIEETSAGGIRDAIERALKRGELKSLVEVASTASAKYKGVPSAAGAKAFETLLSKYGVDWSRRAGGA